MAAVSIAFEAPDNARGASSINSRPIDLVHLAVQTMGDKNLEIEVLHLFARQARAALQEIGHGSSDAIGAAAHRLRSAANAVGAFRVAACCEAVEGSSADAGLLAALGSAVVEAENFILKLSR